MKTSSRRNNRRGNALVLMVVFLVPLIAFLALSIDVGLLAIARTQCQDAADVAALAGVRTLNGNAATNYNYSAVTPAAQQAAANNFVLSKPIATSQVTVNIGRYVYNTVTQQFEGQFPGPSTDSWSLVQATVTANPNQGMTFSKALGLSVPSIQTTATAVHRPRDVAVILDYSGSMGFASYLATTTWTTTALNQSNNPDTLVPQFGAYSGGNSAMMDATSFTSPYDAGNITTTTSDGRPPICADFYQDSSGTPAFAPASASYATTPGGDNCLKISKNTGATYAETLAQVLNIASPAYNTYDTNFETGGYTAYGMTPAFNGYTEGPGYYGKTFFIWPPDARSTHDWRKLYFTYPSSATQMNDNSRLWDSAGNWLAPSSTTYNINYNAILNFIKNVGLNPFPPTMRSGRIVYYTAIPTTIDTSTYPPTDLNQRFWKEYIDFVLGVIDYGGGYYEVRVDGNNGWSGYGTDYPWGTVKITPKSLLTGGAKTPYMFYGDNPLRPKLHFWFGPLTMVDFMNSVNQQYTVTPYGSEFCYWPGTCHQAPMYACKLGVQAALNDINSNHPNDWVSLMFFSTPKQSATDASGARFNGARVAMGTNYQNMQDSLWYPPSTVGNSSATVTPYDANNLEVPRAFGGTCYAMPLMLAYNQFSAASACASYATPTGIAGGNGRKGAQKIIIFETDGAPNTTATASFVNGGQYQSYYNVRYNPASPTGSEYPTGVAGYNDNDPTVTSQIFTLCQQICALNTANPSGYSTTACKVQIHCIGFGPLFAPGSSEAAANIATLNQMQTIGNVNDGMPSYKIVYGDQNTIINSLQTAFTKILESSVPVSLIQ